MCAVRVTVLVINSTLFQILHSYTLTQVSRSYALLLEVRKVFNHYNWLVQAKIVDSSIPLLATNCLHKSCHASRRLAARQDSCFFFPVSSSSGKSPKTHQHFPLIWHFNHRHNIYRLAQIQRRWWLSFQSCCTVVSMVEVGNTSKRWFDTFAWDQYDTIRYDTIRYDTIRYQKY